MPSCSPQLYLMRIGWPCLGEPPFKKKTPGADSISTQVCLTKGFTKDVSEEPVLNVNLKETTIHESQKTQLLRNVSGNDTQVSLRDSSPSSARSEEASRKGLPKRGGGWRTDGRLTHMQEWRWRSLEIKRLLTFCLVSELLFPGWKVPGLAAL